MAIKKGLLKNNTNPDGYYPYTQVDCVFDADGNSLEQTMVMADELGAYSQATPINADMLEGNTLSQILEQCQPQLLWTNPNPTESVGALTATFNHAGYRLLLISFKYISNGPNTYGFQFAHAIAGYSTTLVSHIDGKLRTRSFNITSTGASFSTGYSYNSYGTNTTDSYMNLPYQIYGIK